MPYLNCPNCQLSIKLKAVSFDHCPRCRKRTGEAVPMFVSPLPYRLLTDESEASMLASVPRETPTAGLV